MSPKRLAESEKLVRIDLWLSPKIKAEIDAEAAKRDLTRQYILRERIEKKAGSDLASRLQSIPATRVLKGGE
jgi:hypothetical protein